MTTRFKLLVSPPCKRNAPLFTTFCIYLGTHCSDKEGRQFVSHDFTIPEIDSHIDYLISELEQIRKEAKSVFKKS